MFWIMTLDPVVLSGCFATVILSLQEPMDEVLWAVFCHNLFVVVQAMPGLGIHWDSVQSPSSTLKYSGRPLSGI